MQEMLARLNWTGKEAFHRSERRAVWLHNEETGQKELSGYVKGDPKSNFQVNNLHSLERKRGK